MRHHFLTRLMTILGLFYVLSCPQALYAQAELTIDRIDTENFANDKSPEYGKLIFYLDMFDDRGNFLQGFDKAPPEDLKVFIDGQEIAGEVSIQTFEKANQTFAVAALLASHFSYAFYEEDSGMPNVLGLEKEGFERFFKNLSNQNSVTAWYYNEGGLEPAHSWSTKPRDAADAVAKLVKPQAEDAPSRGAPSFYASIQKVMGEFDKADDRLPPRRILLLMSDGKDVLQQNRSAIEKRLESIADLAHDTGTKIYAIGYSSDSPESLVNLSALASKTEGVFREIPTADADQIPRIIESLADELQNQYVVTFTPTEWRGAEQAVQVRLEVRAPNGAPLQRSRDAVRTGKLSMDHWDAWIKYVVYGLGSLLLLFGLVKVFGALLKRRKNRPQEVYEEEPIGAYKGKLTVLGGAYLGTEFYLVEDITSIGAMSGNSIVLADQGVSKRHAGIKIEDMRFELADFGSTNGTFVNNAKITKQFLRDGDEIRIGEATLRFTLK